MERRGADRSGARSARSIYSHAETCAPAGRQIDMRKISLFMAMVWLQVQPPSRRPRLLMKMKAMRSKKQRSITLKAGMPAMRREWNGRCIRNWRTNGVDGRDDQRRMEGHQRA